MYECIYKLYRDIYSVCVGMYVCVSICTYVCVCIGKIIINRLELTIIGTGESCCSQVEFLSVYFPLPLYLSWRKLSDTVKPSN